MTKKELEVQLLSGKTFQELFHFQAGQGCDIFKAKEFVPGSDILYIPDLDVHDIPYNTPIMGEEDVREALSHCYTGDDFLQECHGDKKSPRFCFAGVIGRVRVLRRQKWLPPIRRVHPLRHFSAKYLKCPTP